MCTLAAHERHQAHKAHQENVPTSGTDTQNVFLCRVVRARAELRTFAAGLRVCQPDRYGGDFSVANGLREILARVGRTLPVDGFRLAYERSGDGSAVVLLHGWPGDRTDYRDVVALLSSAVDVVVPDLRGYGESDRHRLDPAGSYSAEAQARSVVGLIEELGLDHPVIGGYDVGSRIAQTLARSRPDLVRALVVSPPLPGIGNRILTAQAQQEFWYQSFHQLDLAEQLIDGRPHAVRAYLRHFWSHWSGPGYELTDERLDHLFSVYAEPGAFTASIGWYRAGAGAVARSVAEHRPRPEHRIAVPTTVLWPEHDPLFPTAWSDRIDDFFIDAHLRYLDGAGHFTPVESPHDFAEALAAAVNVPFP